MTPEAQRRAIADCMPKLFVIRKQIHDPFGYYREKAAGYTTRAEAWQVTEEEGRKYISGRPTDNDRVVLEPAPMPDYPSDLNAMHKAEETLTNEQQRDYFNELSITSGARAGEHPLYAFTICHATAAQRAEAFLRTLNLWTE